MRIFDKSMLEENKGNHDYVVLLMLGTRGVQPSVTHLQLVRSIRTGQRRPQAERGRGDARRDGHTHPKLRAIAFLFGDDIKFMHEHILSAFQRRSCVA